MKTAMDVVKGKIVDIDEHGVVTIKCLYTDWFTLIKREYKECNIQMIDSRPLSDKQRRACYALIGEIADYVGEGKDRTKEYMKLKFLAEDFGETADKIFSLSNAPMSLVCAFQKYLVSFILQWDIPCHFRCCSSWMTSLTIFTVALSTENAASAAPERNCITLTRLVWDATGRKSFTRVWRQCPSAGSTTLSAIRWGKGSSMRSTTLRAVFRWIEHSAKFTA